MHGFFRILFIDHIGPKVGGQIWNSFRPTYERKYDSVFALLPRAIYDQYGLVQKGYDKNHSITFYRMIDSYFN